MLNEVNEYVYGSSAKWRGFIELTRLHKPILGNSLMFWPAAWGLTLAANEVETPLKPFAQLLFLFVIGTTLVHSAACALNDICDIDFDRQVERCKTRPLVTGIVTVQEAWAVVGFLTAATLASLAFAGRLSLLLGLVGLVPVHALYPLMKRWTWWPQAWLGLAMNWGMLVGWVFMLGYYGLLRPEIWALFFGSACWTIVYDTIYACQDVADDAQAGVKSTALLFGTWVRPILVTFTSVFVLCLLAVGQMANLGFAYYAVSCGGAALHMIWQLATWEVGSTSHSGALFQANGVTGIVVWLGLLLEYYHRAK